MFTYEAREWFGDKTRELLSPNYGIRIGAYMRVLTTMDKHSIPPNAAEIHLCDGLPTLTENASLKDYAKTFRKNALSSFRELAERCKDRDLLFQGIEVFYGVSPLAKDYAQKYGFTISDVNSSQRIITSINHKILIWTKLGRNRYWRRLRWSHGTVKKATISRELLIKNFLEE